jgi:hypothetical protein
MNKRVSTGDIIFLVAALAALVLLWRFLSPPAGFVLACLVAGAALPILCRIARSFLSKSLWTLPIILLIAITPWLNHRFPTLAHRPGVFFAVFASAFAVGVCIVEFSLRPFFPLKSREKQTKFI